MKVLHIIPSISPVRGGPSRAVLEMVQALRHHGADATIVTTNDDGVALLDVPLREWTDYQGVPVQFFDRFSPKMNSIREFAFSSSLTFWLWQHLHEYDLLHIHAIFSYPSTVAMAIARQKQIPYIVRPLGQLCHWSLQQGQVKKQVYLNSIERENLQRAHALHFTSLAEQEEAAQVGLSAPSFVLPHGLRPPQLIPDARQKLHQQLGSPIEQPIILFLSRLHPKKGLPYLFSALSVCQTPLTFVLAGSGTAEHEAEVAEQVRSAGIDSCTHRVGQVAGKFKDLLLQGSDLFALTSHSENFGIAVLEALAAGTPVLTTPGVALSPLVAQERLGWVVELDSQAISQTLQTFLQHPETAEGMGDRARQIVCDRYSWEAVTSSLLEKYQAILSSPASVCSLSSMN
ncbi:MAG: glycosyltransferase [Oscillatoriophycideae cyanobacterium NC_groundwater_1537_Pr4_S-0.65um_50_18]|nr:glycosyltransferase [Oscillatoriophycideae cyanobacterium NC_groundwater_1537_Pr4_S-0.65um_50_18]